MKGLKKIALASAIAAVSAGAQAELKALDDSAMGELTGQAGLTIDLETKYTIGEFMYKDAGSVFFKGISLGASTSATEQARNAAGVGGAGANGFVDNIRIKLDIAGAGAVNAAGEADNELDTGFSRVSTLAGVQAAANGTDVTKFQDAEAGTVALADLQAAGVIDGSAETTAANNATQTINAKKVYDDGDLLIHVSFKDAWQKNGGFAALTGNALPTGTTLGDLNFAQVLTGGLQSVDFNFSIDAIGLAASTVDAGATIGRTLDSHKTSGFDTDGADTTVLISDLSINGYLGPVDISIENNGNGFGAVDLDADGYLSDTEIAATMDPAANPLAGYGAANSKITWNTYVNVTDLDVYLDIAGVQISDMKINNVRGDVTDIDGNFAFGFAQSKRTIYAVRNAAGFTTADAETLAAGSATNNLYDVLALAKDGVAINTHFKGDMEIGALSFGDTAESIGSLYWTDIDSQTNWTISAH